MANFARTLKSPSYLSPRLRPAMPGRTVSSSSDVSVSSNNSARSDDLGDMLGSGPNTPTQLSLGVDGSGNAKGGKGKGKEKEKEKEKEDTGFRWGRGWDDHDVTPPTSTRYPRSRPITIELPTIRKLSNVPVRTPPPPEPLSARGDLPGGYFPLHEDPSGRIHRPHPFQHDARMGRHQPASVAADSGLMYMERNAANSSREPPKAQANTAVASYLPAGFHDSPLPMGKYYPSNYEQRKNNQSSLRPSTVGALSTAKSDSQVPVRTDAAAESEVRRKMLQYQRDMVAQASMAASELLSSSGKSSTELEANFSLNGIPMGNMRFTAPMLYKPRSPRLLPLGSPGPVTPMDLEHSAGGGYLDRGRGDDTRIGEVLASPGRTQETTAV
ncbi:hypothetical protein G7046_g7680 [Stylonectria norvegica]|nr:hypothetical protein G7046_g7680 [Stylonectria norvegica]